MTFILLPLTLASAAPPGEARAPEAGDLEAAQVERVHRDVDPGHQGMVHCHRFRAYHAQRTRDPAVYRVTYEEYRRSGPWRRMRATLRRQSEDWTWVRGNSPRCTIMTMTN